jgi:hypothetical protein
MADDKPKPSEPIPKPPPDAPEAPLGTGCPK